MNKSRKYISLMVLLPAILLLQFVQVGYVHYHRLDNNSLVKHAHVYNKTVDSDQTNKENHSHSSDEIALLSFFDISSINDFVGSISIEAPVFHYKNDAVSCVPSKVKQIVSTYQLRGPPIA